MNTVQILVAVIFILTFLLTLCFLALSATRANLHRLNENIKKFKNEALEIANNQMEVDAARAQMEFNKRYIKECSDRAICVNKFGLQEIANNQMEVDAAKAQIEFSAEELEKLIAIKRYIKEGKL